MTSSGFLWIHKELALFEISSNRRMRQADKNVRRFWGINWASFYLHWKQTTSSTSGHGYLSRYVNHHLFLFFCFSNWENLLNFFFISPSVISKLNFVSLWCRLYSLIHSCLSLSDLVSVSYPPFSHVTFALCLVFLHQGCLRRGGVETL